MWQGRQIGSNRFTTASHLHSQYISASYSSSLSLHNLSLLITTTKFIWSEKNTFYKQFIIFNLSYTLVTTIQHTNKIKLKSQILSSFRITAGSVQFLAYTTVFNSRWNIQTISLDMCINRQDTFQIYEHNSWLSSLVFKPSQHVLHNCFTQSVS